MDFKIIIPLIEKAAPLLAGILGGPAASVAASLIASVCGGEATNPDDLAQRIAADPDAEYKLKQLELQNRVALESFIAKKEEASVEEKKNDIADVEEVRKLNAASNCGISWVILALAPVLIIAITVVLVSLFYISDDIVDHMLVILFLALVWRLKIILQKISDYYLGGID